MLNHIHGAIRVAVEDHAAGVNTRDRSKNRDGVARERDTGSKRLAAGGSGRLEATGAARPSPFLRAATGERGAPATPGRWGFSHKPKGSTRKTFLCTFTIAAGAAIAR